MEIRTIGPFLSEIANRVIGGAWSSGGTLIAAALVGSGGNIEAAIKTAADRSKQEMDEFLEGDDVSKLYRSVGWTLAYAVLTDVHRLARERGAESPFVLGVLGDIGVILFSHSEDKGEDEGEDTTISDEYWFPPLSVN